MTSYDTAQQAQNTGITNLRTKVVLEETAPGVATGEITYEVPNGTRVDLDDMVSELEELKIIQKMIDDWTAIKEEKRDIIKARLGRDGVGYVKGRPVWAHSPTAKFAGKEFEKAHPDLAEQFKRSKLVQVLDTEELAKALPDIYKQFQVSSLRPLGPRS